MNQVISALKPAWAVPGAVVAIDGVHLPVPADGPPHVLVGAADAHVTAASHRSLRIVVPADAEGGTAAVRIDELPGETVYLQIAGVLVSGVHQVDNPAFGKDGLLYCTVSGGRSTKAAVPLYRVNRDGAREPIAIELANPTSLALGPDGRLYVSSRFDGIVYRLLDDDRVEIYATELGTATGLAFGSDGSLFVGDRSGSILRVSPDRQVETWATVPASVAAFHLAFGPEGWLYVTAPTLGARDPVYRISPEGRVEIFHEGFGRPQGLAFDAHGNLFVVDALAGAGGVYRLRADRPGHAEQVVAGGEIIGLAFDPRGGLVLASSDAVYKLAVDVQGLLPFGIA